MNYALNTRAKSLKYEMDMTIRDMTRFAMDMRMVGVSTNLSGEEVPQLRELGVTVKDLSYNERMKNYCAGVSKITNEEYIKAEVEGGMLQRAGIALGPGLRQAYRDYLTKAGEIQVRIRPTEDIDPRTLTMFKPEDLRTILNLTVTANGKPVEDLSFALVAPSVPTAVARGPQDDAKPQQLPAARPPPQVRVQERGQSQPREGTLLQVFEGNAVIERQLTGGSMSLKIPLPRIVKAEVQL
jgi:hypothetical protein